MISINDRLKAGNNGIYYMVTESISLNGVSGNINLKDLLEDINCNNILGIRIRCQNAENTRCDLNTGKPLVSNINLANMFLKLSDKSRNRQITVPLEVLAFDPKLCCDPNFQNIYADGLAIDCAEIVTAKGKTLEYGDTALELMINYCPR